MARDREEADLAAGAIDLATERAIVEHCVEAADIDDRNSSLAHRTPLRAPTLQDPFREACSGATPERRAVRRRLGRAGAAGAPHQQLRAPLGDGLPDQP